MTELSASPSLTPDISSPVYSSPLTPCRTQRQQATFLTASSDSDQDSSDDEEMLTPSKPGKIVVLGTVTPSRAFRIFSSSRPASSSSTPSDAHSAKRRRTSQHQGDTLTLHHQTAHEATAAPAAVVSTLTAPLVTRYLAPARDVGAALLARRSGLARGGSAMLSRVSQASYHQRFEPSPALMLPSLHDAQPSHPLCAAYAFAAKSARAVSARQWLAVGTNDGAVILCDTARVAAAQHDADECNVAAELHASERIAWSACKGSVFDLAWRADDRALVTGGSDYLVRTWDTATLQETGAFGAHRGSPRAVTWDPTHASGSLFVSAGRDGAIHLFDTRTSSGRDEATPAVMSIWGAHTTLPPRPTRGPGSRGGRAGAPPIIPKGVTTLAYVPSRGSHVLASAGCADGRVKLWDLRALSGHEAPVEADMDAAGQKKAKRGSKKQGAAGREDDPIEIEPIDESPDVTQGNDGWNRSSHGISSIVAGSHALYASSTDGRIYTMPLADLTASALTPLGASAPLHDSAQSGNTLYARLALHDDERTLALGCNSGTVTLWDTWAAARSSDYKPAVLAGAHTSNREINAVSWAHGLHGPTLASVSDDYSLRFWRALSA